MIVSEARLNQLEDKYTLRQPAAVRHFLRIHPHLVNVLLEGYTHLQRHFGANSQVVLEIVSDPEVEKGDELFTYIHTSFPPDEAQAKLDKFDQDWFLDQLDHVAGKLNFDVQFV